MLNCNMLGKSNSVYQNHVKKIFLIFSMFLEVIIDQESAY